MTASQTALLFVGNMENSWKKDFGYFPHFKIKPKCLYQHIPSIFSRLLMEEKYTLKNIKCAVLINHNEQSIRIRKKLSVTFAIFLIL